MKSSQPLLKQEPKNEFALHWRNKAQRQLIQSEKTMQNSNCNNESVSINATKQQTEGVSQFGIFSEVAGKQGTAAPSTGQLSSSGLH